MLLGLMGVSATSCEINFFVADMSSVVADQLDGSTTISNGLFVAAE